mgnify:CR=1 FL=1
MMKTYFKIAIAGLLFFSPSLGAQVVQKKIARVEQMPNVPASLEIIDYKKLALDFDKTVFDFNAKGKHWPLVWKDNSQKNYPQEVVGLYTAMADVRQGTNNKGMFHEALATMGATLGLFFLLLFSFFFPFI